MPDQKISELSAIVTIDNATDVLPIVDTSATTTKKITLTQVKTSLALNNVDNTSDANKPVSSAQQTALDAKQATLVSGTNIKTVNNNSLLGSGNITIAGGGGTWGSITGTLSNQTDLQTALDGKVDENAAITGATKTKITYDAKGLVTAGADATTADIADSTDKRYVTDAQLVVVGNTSGTNTGDNATNSQYSGLAASKQDTLVSATNIKTINSTTVLGSGDIAVQATLVSGTNIKTINSTSLLGSGDIVLSASPSGVAGAIQFSNGSAFASDAANLFWDDTNNRLGIGTNAPSATIHLKGSGSTSATTSLLVQNSAGTNMLNVRDDGGIGIFTSRIFDGGNYDKAFYFDGNTAVASNFLSVSLRVFDGTAYASGLEVVGGAAESRVGIGTTSPNASAKLQLDSTTKGFLPPRMTTTQKNAIATPAAGLVVYDTTTNKLQCYDGSSWNDLF